MSDQLLTTFFFFLLSHYFPLSPLPLPPLLFSPLRLPSLPSLSIPIFPLTFPSLYSTFPLVRLALFRFPLCSPPPSLFVVFSPHNFIHLNVCQGSILVCQDNARDKLPQRSSSNVVSIIFLVGRLFTFTLCLPFQLYDRQL